MHSAMEGNKLETLLLPLFPPFCFTFYPLKIKNFLTP